MDDFFYFSCNGHLYGYSIEFDEDNMSCSVFPTNDDGEILEDELVGHGVLKILWSDAVREDVLDVYSAFMDKETLLRVEGACEKAEMSAELSYVKVSEKYRSNGIGQFIVDILMTKNDIDVYCPVYLNASPMGYSLSTLSLNVLEEWYERNGFFTVADEGDNKIMFMENVLDYVPLAGNIPALDHKDEVSPGILTPKGGTYCM